MAAGPRAARQELCRMVARHHRTARRTPRRRRRARSAQGRGRNRQARRDPRAGAESIWEHVEQTPVAIVFGPEHSGLTNEDMSRCHQLIHIPANPEYSSLNIAMAVAITLSEALRQNSNL